MWPKYLVVFKQDLVVAILLFLKLKVAQRLGIGIGWYIKQPMYLLFICAVRSGFEGGLFITRGILH